MSAKKTWVFLSIVFGVFACVEPFEVAFPYGRKILTVDATIKDTDEQQTFTITESESRNSSVYAFPVSNLKVEVIVNNTDKITLTEKDGGIYALPASFKVKAGNAYKLVFVKPDGTKYESAEEIMTTVPEIEKVYDGFMLKGLETAFGKAPANYVYIDTNDPAGEKNNYVWSWRLWEKQIICKSCSYGRYYTSPLPFGDCVREEKYNQTPFFDYACNGNCWDIFYSAQLNVFSDVFSNGKPITGRLVAQIPYYSAEGALIEITQQSVTAAAYRYLKILADQAQTTGSLVDTPPAPVIGNIRNTNNATEAVAGFFMVTGVRKVNYWLSRRNAEGSGAVPTGILGHKLNYEPASLPPDPPRPPLAPCIPGRFRTDAKPEGWVN
ncbi:DUF4249 domain-containing protein [Emticicia sp. 21SJ11W-3]|uniref:DUF4249 domain-containing protein n=1 Tax=Emticicia sp. 21SJ11W-3 TaxID=2916755 RepID=UPI0020A0E051|nr:DUF4249 domain-containing protein [Emticicia sp. 21SJ11W-3]UTA69636.1 DUF4249 domain-containing protein [Emticicia sp. 21SJ11W-3]